MKQILQSLKTGDTDVVDVPCPTASPGSLLIQTAVTVVSAGTERMVVDFGKAGWINKARQQPDKVRMVVDKIRTDGLAPTLDSVRNKLDQPLALGYCNVGRVIDVGAGVSGFAVGDRIVSNGKHAEVVCVPVNLCAKIPDTVPDSHAVFTVLGAIGLQGIRLVGPTLGEAVVVTGLGLIGLMTVQLLRAHGCRVLGIDFDESRLALARQFGAETVNPSSGQDPVAAAASFSRGRGVDAVLITASTDSNEPIHQAALMCRKRGRIVLVGVTGLQLSRADFYEKELSFQVSCSYGPGRYDPEYEDKGRDYPVGFVRWTEQRNFEAVLDMMGSGRLDIDALVSHRYPVDDAPRAYASLIDDRSALGILLEFPQRESLAQPGGRSVALERSIDIFPASGVRSEGGHADDASPSSGRNVSFIGSGNYATAMLIPAFKSAGAGLRIVASNAGVSGVHAARKFGFRQASTDVQQLLADPSTDAVVITTRHDSHARFVLQALDAGKHVFVEKPLCLTLDELGRIEVAARTSGRQVMVGFNRRFSHHARQMKALLDGTGEAKTFVMTVNAGAIPLNHWTQDPAIGGGRIVGEACHFVDLLRFLAGAPIVRSRRRAMASSSNDTVSLELDFADGSIGTVHYLANGNRAVPKERLEVFASGKVLQLDNFRRLDGFGWNGFRKSRLWRQDKGQQACAAAFLAAVAEGGAAAIALDEILEVSRASIELALS